MFFKEKFKCWIDKPENEESKTNKVEKKKWNEWRRRRSK
jgi:hypothetical protein